MKLEGMLTITRTTGANCENISVVIRDGLSGCVIARAEIGMSAFAEALTGIARNNCEVIWTNIDRIGKTREVKTEFVPIAIPSLGYDRRDEEADQQAKPFEVDGWKMSSGGYGNHHRSTVRDGIQGYLCVFIRFVETQS